VRLSVQTDCFDCAQLTKRQTEQTSRTNHTGNTARRQTFGPDALTSVARICGADGQTIALQFFCVAPSHPGLKTVAELRVSDPIYLSAEINQLFGASDQSVAVSARLTL
jgi:hypothetical protein